MTIARIQVRRDTAANWTSANPTLAAGEFGYETDTGKVKIGDGATAWASKAYLIDADLLDLVSRWVAASSAGAASLDFHEDTDNGTNRVRVTAPASVGADRTVTLPDETGTLITKTAVPEVLIIAVGDETTAITTGTAKVTFRMPFAMALTAVRASLTSVSTSGTPTVDINEGGTTILSTKLTIDANEKTSTTAATPAVISDGSLADDAEMTIDIDVAGTGAAGLKVYLIGTRTA